LPAGEDLVASAGIGPVAERAADMPHHDRGRREGTRQLDDIAELRVIEPGVEAETERGQPLESGAEIQPLVEMRPHVVPAVADDRALVPASRVAHAAGAAGDGPEMSPRYRHALLP